MEDLQKENEELKRELHEIKERLTKPKRLEVDFGLAAEDSNEIEQTLSFVVIGASGDLAKKKTFPSLFSLYCLDLMPPNATIYGYARSKMSNEEFRAMAGKNFKGWEDKKEQFLAKFYYVSGNYDSVEGFAQLAREMEKHENNSKANRIFYFAVPPTVFVDVAKSVKAAATGSNRLIIEKPFGRDLESSSILSAQVASLFEEEQIYRIDHYLGKEMVQNIMSLRFANVAYEPMWDRNHIANVVITFKEDIGTEGRGGYFDQFGIIRDVMQNHLLQIFSLVAMEPPVSLSAEDVRDEKVKVLRSTQPIDISDVVIGQYMRDTDGKHEGYLDDKTVPKDSITPTFATAVLHINNQRWRGVPFILKCGKALNERKAEIRIQFHRNPTGLYPGAPRNELVMRVQPDEAIYFKLNSKVPGLASNLVQTELDLTYKHRFDERLPDAYERLIYDVLRGDHNLFVRVDELDAAWKIFTPLLHKLENEKIKPIIYPFGSRGPNESDALIAKYGFLHSRDYKWQKNKL